MAVVHGRTRSLVERFERKEKIEVDENHVPDNKTAGVAAEPVEPVPTPQPQVEL